MKNQKENENPLSIDPRDNLSAIDYKNLSSVLLMIQKLHAKYPNGCTIRQLTDFENVKITD